MGWGDNSYDQASSASGLSNVLAIAAGKTHSLALLDSEPSGSAPVIISSPFALGVVGFNFKYTIKAKNRPSSYGAVGLPSGCAVDAATGFITGVPTTAGPFPGIVSATNDFGTSQKTLNLTINAPSP